MILVIFLIWWSIYFIRCLYFMNIGHVINYNDHSVIILVHLITKI